jgi:peptidyl-tRNA hydrolase, PTH1 family
MKTSPFEPAKLGDITTLQIKRSEFAVLLKPSTYHEPERKSRALLAYKKKKFPLENLLVITDDLNLPFGTIRVKTKGSDGGHNGLKDITATTGNNHLQPLSGLVLTMNLEDASQVDFVLGAWEPEEETTTS